MYDVTWGRNRSLSICASPDGEGREKGGGVVEQTESRNIKGGAPVFLQVRLEHLDFFLSIHKLYTSRQQIISSNLLVTHTTKPNQKLNVPCHIHTCGALQ